MNGTPDETLTVLHELSGAPATAAVLFVVGVVCLLVGVTWLCRWGAAREALIVRYVAPAVARLGERVRRARVIAAIGARIPPESAAFIRARVSPTVELGLHLSVGLVISAAALAGFALIADAVIDHAALVQFDLRLAAAFRATASDRGIATFHAITAAGSIPALVGLALVVGIVLAIRRETLLAVVWLGSLAGGGVLNGLLKHLFHRPRPAGAGALITEPSFSFPSGHAMASIIAYGMLGYLLVVQTRDVRARAAIIAACLSLVALIGFSRLYLGVHYFTDVIGGYAAGAVWLSICLVTAQTMRLRARGTRRITSFSTGRDAPLPHQPDRLATREVRARARRLWVLTLGLGAVPLGHALAQHPVPAVDSVRERAMPFASDPLLDTLVPAALRDAIRRANPDLTVRRAAVDAATARARATGFLAPSTLTTEFEEIPSAINVPRAASIKANVERELFSGPRRSAARAVATADVTTASIVLTMTERRLVATAAQALATATGGTAIAQRLAGEDSLLTSAEVSVRTRFAVGDAKYVDVLRLRTERLRVASERLTALTQARLGRQALIALVTPGGAALAPRGGDTTLVRAAPAVIDVQAVRFVDSLLAARTPLVGRIVLPPAPDAESLLVTTGRLAAANAAYARAASVRALALAELRPRVSMILGAQRFVGDNGGFTVGPTIGATVTLPFTARSATSTARTAAERDLILAGTDRTATLASARAGLLAAAERYDAARARVTAYDAALLRGAREEREAALASYRTGGITLLELLDFERALARAEIDRIRGVIDAATALGDLLGGGLTPTSSLPAGLGGAASAIPGSSP